MNYIKLHNKFINYCKNTTIIDRIYKRNNNDFRLDKEYIYTENHHIIPKHSDGTDIIENYIKLLPEEHLFIHKLRWKAYKERGDMLAVRYIINGINNKTQKKERFDNLKLNISKKLKQSYLWIKQNSAEVRKTHGWQTEDGKKRISESRKGQIPVIDKEGNSFTVTKDHPEYINGNFVHHTKGKSTYLNKKTGKKEYINVSDRQDYHIGTNGKFGQENSNASGLSDEYLINIYYKISIDLNIIPSKADLIKICYNKNIKIIKSFKSRFDGKGYKELVRLVENRTNMKFNPYLRGDKLKEYKQIIKEYCD